MLIPRETLMKIVAPTASSTTNKVSPILENIVFSGANDRLAAYSYNMLYSVTAQTYFPVEEEFKLLIHGKKFLGILKALPENCDVSIERKDNKVVVKHSHSRFTLNLLNLEDYPIVDSVNNENSYDISLSALKFASSAMAKNDARPYLNGVLLRPIDKDIDFVATNGHRLSRQTVTNAANVLFEGKDAILPGESVNAVLRLFNGASVVKASIGQDGLRKVVEFVSEDEDMVMRLNTSLIDSDYVAYERVIPNHPYEIGLNTQTLLNAIEIVHGLRDSSASIDAVTIKISGATMSFEHRTPSEEVAVTEIEIEASNPIEISLNVHYILDALNSLKEEEEIVFSYDTPDRAVKIEANQKTCIIMPIRL